MTIDTLAFARDGGEHDDDGADDGQAAEKKQSTATKLVALARSLCLLWHNGDHDGFATIDVDRHREHWPIRSKGFKNWLQHQYHIAEQSAAGSQAIQDALGTLEGFARFEGEEHAVAMRVAEHEGKVYLDLANDAWQAVEIDGAGWRVVDNPPVMFRRAKAMLPLPTPCQGDVNILRDFVNVHDHDWPLLLAFLVSALYHRGPYPCLFLTGEQGSAKSTLARLLRSLIDPNTAPLRVEPRDPRDLMIAANNGRLVVLDNVSKMPAWLSDALCRLSTGGGFSTRTLYENDEETIFDAMRPVILTGIEDVVTRGDLLDRTLVVNLPTIPERQRRPEKELWKAFNSAAPAIMGGLLTALATSIRELPTTTLGRLPRMADFALLATAAEPSLGLATGAFVAAYSNNRQDANSIALEADVVAKYLMDLASSKPWEGTATDLLAALDNMVTDQTRKRKDWPTSPRTLSGIIRRLSPNLRRVGVEVDQWRECGGNRPRMLQIRREAYSIVPTVPPVPNAVNQVGNVGRSRDAGDAAGTQHPAKTPIGDDRDDRDAKIQLHSYDDQQEETWTA